MKTEQYGVVTSIKNLSDDIIPQGYFVSVNGTQFNSSEDNNLKLGVCLADTPIGEMMPVAVSGIVLCVTAGSIIKGSKVMCDGAISQINFSVPPTTQELQQVVGVALDEATGADEVIRVLLK